jgi:hypothetical protein
LAWLSLPPEWLAALLEGLQATQQGLRTLLHAVGLAPDAHGQPAWPFAHRVAAEMLVVDTGHARRVLLSLLCVGVALLALAERRCHISETFLVINRERPGNSGGFREARCKGFANFEAVRAIGLTELSTGGHRPATSRPGQ